LSTSWSTGCIWFINWWWCDEIDCYTYWIENQLLDIAVNPWTTFHHARREKIWYVN
jgi:hypothetical protein